MKLLNAALFAALSLTVPALAYAAKPALAPKKPAVVVPTDADFEPLDADDMLVVDTNKGRVIVALTSFSAPNAVAQVKTLARQHFYDGQTFFRVVDDFMDQTGDPTNKGDGGSKLPDLKAEFTFRRNASSNFVQASARDDTVIGFIGVLPVASQPDELMLMTADAKVTAWPLFCAGVMGMARNAEPDSANSQFFFMRGAYPSLEKKYTGFGRVVVGEDVVKAIKSGEPVPEPQDQMVKVRLGSDMPAAERPKVYVLNTRSAAFRSLIERAREEKGGDFSACDIDIPVQVR